MRTALAWLYRSLILAAHGGHFEVTVGSDVVELDVDDVDPWLDGQDVPSVVAHIEARARLRSPEHLAAVAARAGGEVAGADR